MKIEIDDEYADEVVAAILREIYVDSLYKIKMEGRHTEDEAFSEFNKEFIADLEEIVIHIPPVLAYIMPEGAYEEFMQRVKEMKEND